MEFLWLKFLPIFYIITFTSCQIGGKLPIFGGKLFPSITTEENYFIGDNIFSEKSEIKTGDIIECEVMKSKKMESNKADSHIFTSAANSQQGFAFYPIVKDKKCFSFKLRTADFPFIILRTVPRVISPERLDIILRTKGQSMIRIKNVQPVSTALTPDIVNDKELHGFWIRWLDDYLVELGRDTDNSPILSYTSPDKLSINFVGISSYGADGEWIIHDEPKCGQYNNVTDKIVTEIKCKMLPIGGSLPPINHNILENIQVLPNNPIILEKSQMHILNQIKNQREIFKTSKFRSKELLLEYLELLKKHFRNAESNQNQIYAADTEIYSPLKANTFNEINKQYFQFLEEIQMELTFIKDTTNDKIITYYVPVQNYSAESGNGKISTHQNWTAHTGLFENMYSQAVKDALKQIPQQ